MKTIELTGADLVRATTPIKRRTPIAYASQFGPAGRRTQWWVSYNCPFGCGSHFGRSRNKFQNGPRTSGCGRRIELRIARTYRGKSQGAS